MPVDEKLALEEEKRAEDHEKIKSEVREGIHQKIRRSAQPESQSQEAQVKGVAAELKQKAVAEVGETEQELDRARKVARISQIFDYVFFLIYGIVGLEIFLELFGAREANAFKQFVDVISYPILGPFRGLFGDPGVGPFRFMFSYVFALIFYGLLHLAINRLLRIFVHRKTSV